MAALSRGCKQRYKPRAYKRKFTVFVLFNAIVLYAYAYLLICLLSWNFAFVSALYWETSELLGRYKKNALAIHRPLCILSEITCTDPFCFHVCLSVCRSVLCLWFVCLRVCVSWSVCLCVSQSVCLSVGRSNCLYNIFVLLRPSVFCHCTKSCFLYLVHHDAPNTHPLLFVLSESSIWLWINLKQLCSLDYDKNLSLSRPFRIIPNIQPVCINMLLIVN